MSFHKTGPAEPTTRGHMRHPLSPGLGTCLLRTGLMLMLLTTIFMQLTGVIQAEETASVTVFSISAHPVNDATSALAAQIRDMLRQNLAAQGIMPPPTHTDTAPPIASGSHYIINGSLTLLANHFSLDIALSQKTDSKPPRYFFAEGESIESMAEAVNKISDDICATVFHKQKITDIVIQGNLRIEADAVKRVIQTTAGDLYSRQRLSEDLKRIYAMGYFEDVRIEAEDAPTGKKIRFIVKERPTLRDILIKNNKLFSDEEIKKQLTIDRGAIISIVKINMNVKNIKQMYKEKNYHNINVTYETLPQENNQADIQFTIDHGKQFLIKKIAFEGNTPAEPRTGMFAWVLPDKKTITSDATLADIIETDEKGFFSWLTDSGNLKLDELRQDTARLTAHYHNNGYIEAKIADPEIEFEDEWIYITFKIEEGKRFKIGDVRITGDLLDNEETMRQQLTIKKGDYFNRSLVRQDMLVLSDLYADQGYFYADVVPQTDKDDDTRTVDINYTIQKGGLVYFDKIIITGNIKTRDKVIRRELDVHEQELFSGKRLKRSIYRLYRLDFFDPAELKVDTVETGKSDAIDLKIEVKEKPTGSLSFGGGYSSTEHLFAMASISQRNLFGRGQNLQLQAEVGGTSTEYKLSFTEPWLFDIPLSAGFDLYNWEVDYDYYDKTSVGGGLRFGYPVLDNTRLYLSNTYERNHITGISVFAADSIQSLLETGETRSITSSVSTTLLYDTRDRAINPTRGSKHLITIEKAGGDILGGEVSFTKYTGELGWYIPLFWETFGMLHAEGAYLHEGSGGYVPDYERFYLGGINSLRGFDWHDIHLLEDDGVSERGGDKYVQFNIEFLAPLFDETVGLVGLLFFDAGNVYYKDSAITVDTFRESAGFGIRWNSPMGPIRLERGYILDPQEGESSGGQWEFTMGAAF